MEEEKGAGEKLKEEEIGETKKDELEDSKDETKDASETKKVQEGDNSAYAGIPKELLNCAACDKTMWDGLVRDEMLFKQLSKKV